MTVFAHADDETTVSPVLAKYVREGIKVHLVIATDGRHGIRPHFGVPAGDSLALIREAEIRCAAETIGISSLVLLDFEDGTLANPSTLQHLGKQVDSLFQMIQPDLLMSWGPDGGYGHPDHRTISNISTEVFQKYPSHSGRKLCYFGLPRKAIFSIPSPKTELGKLLKSRWKTTNSDYLDSPIVVKKEDIEVGRTALACHQSQFTEAEMNDFYNILHQYSDTVYLRNWH
tara:strand:+ start:2465 stop:3151 length:687 start_codon:yes stop_codon:yes gene_type:complete